jgi:RNA polymerase primary sigma factor
LSEYTSNSYNFSDSYGSEPLLTAAEEVSLIHSIQLGKIAKELLAVGEFDSPLDKRKAERNSNFGDKAHERFVRANVRLSMHVARKYNNRGLAYEDLVQEGIFGIMHAIRKFDPERGFRFSTYAMPWVRQQISRAVINTGSTVRVPEHRINELTKISRMRSSLMAELGRDAEDFEVSDALGMTIDDMLVIESYAAQPISLHTPIGEEGSELGDLLMDESADTEAEAIEKDLSDRVETTLRGLNDREALVIRHRFGLHEGLNSEVDSFATIAGVLGVTRERVRQIERTAIAKLRHPKNTHLRAFLL